MRRARRSLPLLAVALLAACATPDFPPAAACPGAGAWVEPGRGALPPPALFDRIAQSGVVLLGEAHDRADHHRWQAQVVAGLLARRADLVIGLEMLPRTAQPALDRWVAGAVDEAGFLAETDWARAWGFDFSLYRPIFEVARLNRLKMVGLNLDREAVARVGREGFEAAATGLGRPVEPPPDYLARLGEIWAEHRREGADEPAFRRFVEAQLTWDRAMAEAIAAARRDRAPLVVGIVGRGHLEHRWGVPRQLAALGERSTVLLPWPAEECEGLRPEIADAVFGFAPPPPAPPPLRLGVMLERAEEGARVRGVSEGSVAAASGLQAGDVVVRAAGKPIRTPDDLVAVIRKASPGLWIPLELRRDGAPLDAVVKFPP